MGESAPAGEPVDLSRLRDVVGDDHEFLAELIRTFLSDTDTQIASLDSAIESGDLAAAQRQAHTLRGSSATVGAERMRVHALAAETALRAPDIAAATKSLAELRNAYAEARAHLEKVLQGL